MQKKNDKVGNKTANKQERQGKKREQERKIQIDSQKKIQILAFAWKPKKRFNYVRLVEKYAFFFANLFLAILMLINGKLVQRRGIGEKCGFFSPHWLSPKG